MNDLEKKHIDKFGVKPVIIGINWNDPEKIPEGIIDAIEKNKPYNEYDQLSDEDKKLFDEGKLLF